MRRSAWFVVVIVCCLLPASRSVGAQRRDRDRPIRVGNTNVLFFGGGYGTHDHPTFTTNGFVNIAYQRRILRRELRFFPVWVRGAVNFTEENRDLDNTFTYWREEEGIVPNPDPLVQERTSDFTVRVEMLGDLLHTRNSAVYAGGGFSMHLVNFSSRGTQSRDAAGIETNDSILAGSALVGGRLFMAKKPYTLYAEVRYGRTYGSREEPPNLPKSLEDFEFTGVNNVTFEGGVGLHW
ncbi:MAG: hypothetical protein ACE5G2_02250 [Candidatus Krumholzibacteriia bacterium]